MKSVAVAVLLLLCGSASCFSVGAERIDRDNLEYGESWGNAAQSEMLLNIVKLRYSEAPMFLEVASVINQYSLEGQVGVNAPAWDRPSTFGPPFGSASGRWADRPTITYTPMTGERFTRSLLTPIPPASLVSMLQSGWPAEFVLGITARSINGISNGTRSALLRQDPDPRFGEVMRDLTEIQQSSRMGMRVVRGEGGNKALITIARGGPDETRDVRRRLSGLLGLEPDAREIELVYGMLPARDNEIAILSRSILAILSELSFGVEVPPRHVMEGRTSANPQFDGAWSPPRIWIHSGEDRPKDAFVTVPYRGLWFWIDDRDFASKRLFSFAMILIALAESDTKTKGPVVTVGAGS